MATRTESKITATLIRGKNYFFKDIHFVAGQPTEVDRELAEELELLFDEITDSEQQVVLRPRFKLDYHANAPESSAKAMFAKKPSKKLQTSATTKEDEADDKPRLRKPFAPKGVRPRVVA